MTWLRFTSHWVLLAFALGCGGHAESPEGGGGGGESTSSGGGSGAGTGESSGTGSDGNGGSEPPSGNGCADLKDEALLQAVLAETEEFGLSREEIAAAASELQNVTELTVEGVASLDGIGCLSELRVLILRDTTLSDVEPLSDLGELERLSFVGAPQLSALSPLGQHPSLNQLFVGDAAVTSLEGLPQLQRISLVNLSISDYSPLTQQLELLSLTATGSVFSDLSLIATLPQLTFVTLIDTDVTSLAPLLDSPNHGSLTVIDADWESLEAEAAALSAAGWCVTYGTQKRPSQSRTAPTASPSEGARRKPPSLR